MENFRKNKRIKGYILIADYPGNTKPIGHFEPYTNGKFSSYPHIWKEVLYKDVFRDEVLNKLGIK